ncbi:hypothetical protein [Parafilimonas sp.]|uniref:hypothetical protein n=1 Tax=Parafilimonas sp. TaxID=1969739 RepID=UPI0039E3215F
MKKILLIGLAIYAVSPVFSQQNDVSFSSSDTALQTAFYRAKEMALSYKGRPDDPVGAWYESALPPRSAFCMRDVAHQSIPAEILGLSAANRNMFTAFIKNISASKDWCSYWEINKYGKPAPEDYRSDSAFWYNLNANFDILTACWKLYLWTGDKDYINSPVFKNFHDKSANEYIDSWVLQADSLLTRPAHPNAAASFNIRDNLQRCRGLPSYSEGVPGLKLGIDLVAALYRGLLSYADILAANGNAVGANLYRGRAVAYQRHIDTYWWDEASGVYNTYYSDKDVFGKNEGETFLLWFDALKDSVRKKKTIEHLLGRQWNVENMSYFPCIFYRNGYWNEAKDYMLLLTNPGTKRREYPEVSYGVILGFVNGLMGIEPDARYNRVTTVYRDNNTATSSVKNVPVLGNLIDVHHEQGKTAFVNHGKQTVTWRAAFYGLHKQVAVNGKNKKAAADKDNNGQTISYIDTVVKPGEKIMAEAR